MFTKVKAVLIAAAIAALAGLAGFITDVDWSQFGSFGPAIGMAIAAAVAYAVKELRGYGPGTGTIADEGDADSAVLPEG